MNKPQIKKLLILIVLVIFTYLCTSLYRPWAYAQHVGDFHFADSHPNLMCVPVAYSLVCFIYSLLQKKMDNPLLVVLSLALGFLAYEFAQIIFGGFDIFDCIAIFAGALLTLVFAIKE